MKPISTFAHGILDWLTSTAGWSLPRIMGWSDEVRNLHTAVACSKATYSLLTDYELGLIRVLPMRAHLALDAIGGAFCLAAPLLLRKKDCTPDVIASFLGVGALELSAAFLTQTTPSFERRRAAQPVIRGINEPVPSVPGGSPSAAASSGEVINENIIDDIAPRTAGEKVGAGIE